MTINQPFKLMTTEVAVELYQSVTGANPSLDPGCWTCPVETVSWYEAVEFANSLSALEGLDPCYVINGTDVTWFGGLDCEGWRLPTEAEWEYAARAGTDLMYAGSNDVDEVAWTANNHDTDGRTHPVGTLAPNAWGLYDMSGNVWEWVWDEYEVYPTDPASDPTGAESGVTSAYRVFRGGSWSNSSQFARLAFRFRYEPGFSKHALGFRLARSSFDP